MTEELPTNVRLLDPVTLTELFDFHDPTNGVDVARGIERPKRAQRQGRLKTARVHGSFPAGPRVDDDGSLLIPVLFLGSSWGQVEQRFLDAHAVLEANDEMIVETELSGVTTRYFTDAPVDIEPVSIDRKNNRQRYDFTFLVQPNPTVTIA